MLAVQVSDIVKSFVDKVAVDVGVCVKTFPAIVSRQHLASKQTAVFAR